jgi:transposase
MRKGNSFLKGILTEAAWAASRTKGSAYYAVYHNLAKRIGKKKALVAVAHRMLIDIFRILKTKEPYQDAGAEAVHERILAKRERYMVRSLEKAGYSVTRSAAA